MKAADVNMRSPVGHDSWAGQSVVVFLINGSITAYGHRT
jgi:hypothetical protein